MQVCNLNNIKIYNLSAGKSLPEWISDQKKRKLQNKDVEIQRRIELIQEFEMPAVSNCVRVSPDQQYICASGVYKPRLKCYDVNQLSLKFERCMDSETVKFQLLADDYSKIVMLQNDRYIEIHSQQGRYYRTRIPKYGRDLSYHAASCDMYVVGASSEIYRLNLEQGRFLAPLKTNATEILCSQFNPEHHLFTCGTIEGHVECWDPRSRNRVGSLDCAKSQLLQDAELDGVPSVTAIQYRDGLQFGVGTSTGQVLLYDLRSPNPLLLKDHQYGLPVHSLHFHRSQDLVLSCDTRILKMWDRNNGKPFTSIEPGTPLNDLCVVPNTGMVFLANESPKILTYYIPALGSAPKWCSFLDSLTEEMEENPTPTVYDDYKFLTRTELESLGLAHLVGSKMLRAYMHGYFMDKRLYNKAKSIADPFAYDEYRRTKIREKIEEERADRIKIHKLPKVNRQLAEKLIEQTSNKKKSKKKDATSLIGDDRFGAMFSNPSFQVDMESDEYRLLNPLVSKMDKARVKKQDTKQEESEEELEGRPSEEEDMESDSSDDDNAWKQEVKQQHQIMKQEAQQKRRNEQRESLLKPATVREVAAPLRLSHMGRSGSSDKKKQLKRSLGERLKHDEETGVLHQSGSSVGNMEMTFKLKKSEKDSKQKQKSEEHHAERKKLRRSAGDISKQRKLPGQPWNRGKLQS